MTAKPKQEGTGGPPPPDTIVDDVTTETSQISQWEFVDRVPTRDDVLDLLGTLPPVWGVKPVDFADFVQALPQSKKVKVAQERTSEATGETRTFMVDEYKDAWTLYMSVAGRIKMVEAAAAMNGWAVDFEPEPVTPTGVPGYLVMEERLVYREYVVVTSLSPTPGHEVSTGGIKVQRGDDVSLGRKPGTAWVPLSGGKAAAASNPYEKVETSARGRAIAAWGFGVLPGSGIASVEEMAGVPQNRAALSAEDAPAARGSGGAARRPRDELLQDVLETSEALRQARGIDEFDMRARTAKFLADSLGVRDAWDEAKGEIDWSKVRDGQLVLIANSQRESLAKIIDAGSPV